MFEVYPVEGGYRWQIIAPCGRPLYYADRTVYLSNIAAASAANDWRTRFWEIAGCIERYPGNF